MVGLPKSCESNLNVKDICSFQACESFEYQEKDLNNSNTDWKTAKTFKGEQLYHCHDLVKIRTAAVQIRYTLV